VLDLLTNPGVGDPAGIRRLAAARDDEVDDLDLVVQRGSSALAETAPPVWEGAARDAFATGLDQALRDARTLRTGLDEHAEALRVYARAVEGIQERQRELERRRGEVERERAAAIREEGLMLSTRPAETLPFGVVLPSAADRVAAADALGRRLDLDWDDLVADRRRADAACRAALGSTAALGKLALVLGTSSAGCPTSGQLLRYLSDLSATDMRLLAERHPEVLRPFLEGSPRDVHEWWASMDGGDPWVLSPRQAALVGVMPGLLGRLDGLPPHARIAANAINAAARLRDIERELVLPGADVASLRREKEYLQRAVGPSPSVQLYLYDHDGGRLIEMFGTFSATTNHVATYVPGTFTSLDSFYATEGGVQEMARWLHDSLGADAVTFAYKDGAFPGEHAVGPREQAWGIGEANSEIFTALSSVSLVKFQRSLGLTLDTLPSVTVDAVGHSWGLADITSSECLGVHYDRVVSLSGAGMPLIWKPDAETEYYDFSYDDALQVAQDAGLVWHYNNPRHRSAFTYDEYYSSSRDSDFQDDPFAVDQVADLLMDNHSLVASATRPENRQVRDDLLRVLKENHVE